MQTVITNEIITLQYILLGR